MGIMNNRKSFELFHKHVEQLSNHSLYKIMRKIQGSSYVYSDAHSQLGMYTQLRMIFSEY
jgi:hypothetical protein